MGATFTVKPDQRSERVVYGRVYLDDKVIALMSDVERGEALAAYLKRANIYSYSDWKDRASFKAQCAFVEHSAGQGVAASDPFRLTGAK